LTDIAVDTLQELQSWIGRTELTRDTVTPQLAERLAATLESSPATYELGDELPQGWHAVLFPRVVARSRLGADGHPALGDFLPPVPLPKRMFAGKRMRFEAPIRIGDSLHRVSEIAAITPKQGASGPLVFVTVRHTIRATDGVCVVEEQDVVYRSADAGTSRDAPRRAPTSGLTSAATQRVSPDIVADETTLFRYSALCFNGHRIHYDQPYASGVEGYPALVVNGGLSMMYALEHLRAAWPGRLHSLVQRNLAPLFLGEVFRVESAAGDTPGGVEFRVVSREGKVAVAGSAMRTDAEREAAR
jgi:3-methylfumaryl-CoA hydratase